MFAGRRADDAVYAAPASLRVIVLGSCVGVVGASAGRDGVNMYVSLCGVFKRRLLRRSFQSTDELLSALL